MQENLCISKKFVLVFKKLRIRFVRILKRFGNAKQTVTLAACPYVQVKLLVSDKNLNKHFKMIESESEKIEPQVHCIREVGPVVKLI